LNSEIKIRKFNHSETDAAALHSLINQFDDLPHTIPVHDITTVIYNLDFRKSGIFIAEKDKIIIGFAVITEVLFLGMGRMAELQSILIDKNYRKCGIGRLLLRQCEKWCIEYCYSEVILSSRVQLEGAHQFYEKLGYRKFKQSYYFQKTLFVKDTLYAEKCPPQPFVFNVDVTRSFCDMIARSIPHYYDLLDMICSAVKHFYVSGTGCYELGCSNGNLSERLVHSISDIHLTAVDNSDAMLSACRQRLNTVRSSGSTPGQINILNHDLNLPFKMHNASTAVILLTLQFIKPENRAALIRSVYNGLRDNGALILVEKVSSKEDESIESLYNAGYRHYKRSNGYSELEIDQKNCALDQVLIPFSDAENISLLKQAGFRTITTFYKWFNFSGYIAVKGG